MDYLQRVKEYSGKEIKTQILEAMILCFDADSIGEDPNSSFAELEESLVRSMNLLSAKMSQLANYYRTKHGIELTTDTWQRFGLIPPTQSIPIKPLNPPNYLNPGLGLSPEQQERLLEIDRILAGEIEEQPDETFRTLAVKNQEQPDEIEEDNEDDEDEETDGETDGEYLARAAHMVKRNSTKVSK